MEFDRCCLVSHRNDPSWPIQHWLPVACSVPASSRPATKYRATHQRWLDWAGHRLYQPESCFPQCPWPCNIMGVNGEHPGYKPHPRDVHLVLWTRCTWILLVNGFGCSKQTTEALLQVNLYSGPCFSTKNLQLILVWSEFA